MGRAPSREASTGAPRPTIRARVAGAEPAVPRTGRSAFACPNTIRGPRAGRTGRSARPVSPFVGSGRPPRAGRSGPGRPVTRVASGPVFEGFNHARIDAGDATIETVHA